MIMMMMIHQPRYKSTQRAEFEDKNQNKFIILDKFTRSNTIPRAALSNC